MFIVNNSMTVSEFINAPDTVDFILRPTEYLALADDPRVLLTQTLGGRYAVAYANVNDFLDIVETLGTNFINATSTVLGTLDRANLEAAGITQVQRQPYLSLTGSGVLMGFVDTGIDYTLDVFRYEDGRSKIRYIFDQSIDTVPPEGFFVGTEYTNEQINTALGAENPYDIVPHRDLSGHGTFLASIAAGREIGDYIGAAPDAELIVVKLKRARPYYLQRYAVPENQENAFESNAVMVGVEYILMKATELARPVVICIGLGTNFGSHDGFSAFEEYLSSVSNLRGVCLCTAAGNESQARHHMQGTIPAQNETANIDLRIGADAGDILISVWSAVSDRLAASVRSPTGELAGRFAAVPGNVYRSDLILERSSIIVEYHFPVEGSGGQLTVVKLLDATPGIWTIIMYGDIVLDGTFNAWLPMTGFVSPEVEFLSATPYTTITIPGTMIGAMCVGAYNSNNNILYSQSSWGPTRAPMMAPDFVAPGVDVGGFYPTGYGMMSGTSVATAITAGAAALLMQWGVVEGNDPALSTFQIRAYLIRGCTRREAVSYPNPQWGYGMLNLLQAFQIMRGV